MKTYKNIKLDHETEPGASHQPLLIWAVENTTGPVLELGCGDYSTPLLHDLLKDTKRKLVSVDDDLTWMGRFSKLTSITHSFVVTNQTKWKETIDSFANIKWGVVFVDQGYTKEIGDPARIYSVQRLAECAEYIVAHDADFLPQMQSTNYNWDMYFPKYTPIVQRKGPPSYIISKTHDVKTLSIIED